ncbi:MAG: creatininase family protein [Candidatus Saliniplasma sp.]
MQKTKWGEMTRAELEQRTRFIDTALLPIGSIEQHGPHLPLDTDTYDAGYILEESVKRIDRPKPLILPTIPYGVSDHHMAFPGTITIKSKTLQDMIIDIGRSIIQHGIQKLFIYNAHGGNTSTIKLAASKLKRETGLLVFIDSGESMGPGKERYVDSENDVHAGEYETSTSMANRGELVEEEAIPEKEMDFPDDEFEFDNDPPFLFTWDTHELSKIGVLGDPKKATKEKGEKLWDEGITILANRIKKVMEMDKSLLR